MKEDSYDQLKNKLEGKAGNGSAKVISLKRQPWIYSAAASLVILAAFIYWMFFKVEITTYQCKEGQTMSVVLPDSTEATLSGYSAIDFAQKSFTTRRAIRLRGLAYFNVKRKGHFKVNFDQGEVNVLGTRFDILSGKEIATVKCYEGKVQVLSDNMNPEILTAGMGLRVVPTMNSEVFSFTAQNPEWVNGESIFKDAPLQEVIEALSIQYNIEIDAKGIDTNRKYSGKFGHKDLDKSMEMVFQPMGISYEMEASSANRRMILRRQ